MKTIYIVSLESLPNRYTCEWLEGIPTALHAYADLAGVDVNVVNIVGDDKEQLTTPGAFINFAGTNKWKSEQSIKIAKLIAEGKIKDGDKFLFTDAWNPVILQVKYMLDLLGIKAELHGIWHAGQYDPQDFLGRLIEDKRWARSTEEAIFWALNKNIYATEFHQELFYNGVFGDVYDEDTNLSGVFNRMMRSGQPHECLLETLDTKCNQHKTPKKDMILFPHRIAPEKQHDIFLDLKASMPEYEFVTCQEQRLTKDEYHQMLLDSKLTFSANLQETFGISSCMEAPMTLNISMVPDRLSYSEIFEGYDQFLYPSEWTTSFDAYLAHKEELMEKIRNLMTNYDKVVPVIKQFNVNVLPKYAMAHAMYSSLIGK
jgi:glycosyltransferase involved in cell wall biosynthesis